MQHVVVLTAVALLIVIGSACSDTDGASRLRGTASPDSATANPTPASDDPFIEGAMRFPAVRVYMTGEAMDAIDAAALARDKFNDAMSFRSAHVESMEYVRATAGQARSKFGYGPNADGTQDSLPEDAPVVILVAYGRFQAFSLSDRFSETPPPSLRTAWLVVPLGHAGTRIGTSNQTYDLSELGDVHQVSMPLPLYPTPVLTYAP